MDKSTIIQALSENPNGLRISQLTGICKISAKTAKEIIKACGDEVVYKTPCYYLKDSKPKNIKSKIKVVTRKELFLTHKEVEDFLKDYFKMSSIISSEKGILLTHISGEKA